MPQNDPAADKIQMNSALPFSAGGRKGIPENPNIKYTIYTASAAVGVTKDGRKLTPFVRVTKVNGEETFLELFHRIE